MTQKVYVDVDDTLVIWDYPSYVNQELVDILKKGINAGLIDISIWSGTGQPWAEKYSKFLFSEYNLETYSKDEKYDKIPSGCFAIDDRRQEEREYLEGFDKVFLPAEFITYMREKLNAACRRCS